ncbi:MAG: hypothetical protein ACRC9X_08705 [Bacteroidales bacterium]
MKRLVFASLMTCIFALTSCLPDDYKQQFPSLHIGTVRLISSDTSRWYIELDDAKKIWVSNTNEFAKHPSANTRVLFTIFFSDQTVPGYEYMGALSNWQSVDVLSLQGEHRDSIITTKHGGVYQVNNIGASGGQYLNIDVTFFYSTDFSKHSLKILCDTTSKNLPLHLHLIHQDSENSGELNLIGRLMSLDMESLQSITDRDSISFRLTTKINNSSTDYISPIIGYRFK